MAQRSGNAQRWETIGKKGAWQIRHINPYSDGQQRHWPARPYRPSSEEKYLIHLAKAWVKKDRLEQPGVEYYLDKLPDGYALFELNQPSGTQVYKRLFGHPSGRYYDSIVRFEVHFLWLMSGMNGACECVHCGKPRPKPVPRNRHHFDKLLLPKERTRLLSEFDSAVSRSSSIEGRPGGSTSSRPQRQVRAVGAAYAHDVDGVEDVYKELLKRLEAAQGSSKGIEDHVREINSMDWRAEHSWDGLGSDLIQRSLTTIEHQHVFVPRVGELVLWCPNFLDGHYIMLDTEKGEYKFYSPEQECFHGFPEWKAGVVATVPSGSDGPVDFPDIQTLPDKRNSLNISGFRVETFPDPNNEINKKASKQYRYVPLRNIRPLSHWQMLLRGVPQERRHPSIRHALTCMTSISLLEKWWFQGEWPNASILCKGIYIGAELITVGDTVRISPETSSSSKARKCTDVLVVDSIRLNILDIKPEHISPDSPHLSSTSSITLVGRAYTLDIRRHYQMQGQDPDASQTVLPFDVPKEEVKTVFRPVGSDNYGLWYYLHDPSQRFEVSYDEVLGRMYEAAAVQLWTGLLQHSGSNGNKPAIRPTLDYDMGAIEEARRYATQADQRLEQADQGQVLWFWADNRAEALDIETINGLEVSRYHDIRDKETLEAWKAQLRILNGHPAPTEWFNFTSNFSAIPGATRGRKPGSKVVDGKVIAPGTEGFDEMVADPPEQQSTPKHKTSQLAGAALVVIEDEDDDSEDVEIVLSTVERHSGEIPERKQPRTKQQIMLNADADLSDDYDDDDDWITEPLPIRGGTEESEGGDYDPRRKDD